MSSEPDNLAERLDAFLSTHERADSWRVERVLKKSAFETTELVVFEGARGGAFGPFVRKRIDCSAGVGSAYEDLWEAQRAGTVLHHVPRMLECTRMGTELTIVEEYVSGPTLADLVSVQGGSESLARTVMPTLCDAVAELHERLPRPLIHRDLKPSNIIVRGGEPVIIDFGIARSWHADADADTAHFGTRAYAPPEQFGFGQTDERTDVYALGKLLLFCLIGEEPATVADPETLVTGGVPNAYAQVIARATAFDPAMRYASARALGRAVREVASGENGVPSASPVDGASNKQGHEADADAGTSVLHAAGHQTRGEYEGKHTQTLGERISHGLGRAWNVAVLLVYILMATACLVAAFNPNEHDKALPLWFRLLEYGTFAVAVFGATTYALLDKRRLFGRYPQLARISLKRQLLLCAAIVMGSIVGVAFIGMSAGLL